MHRYIHYDIEQGFDMRGLGSLHLSTCCHECFYVSDTISMFIADTELSALFAEFLTIMQHNNPDVQKASSFFRDRPNTFKISGDVWASCLLLRMIYNILWNPKGKT